MARPSAYRLLAAVILLAGVVASVTFANRTLRSFQTLIAAHEAGAPSAGAIRAWMTLDYVATAYAVAPAALADRLGLPAAIAGAIAIGDIADQRGVEPTDMVQAVQRAVAVAGDATPATGGPKKPGIADALLSALVAYSYPALGLILLLGAIGAPVPTGFAAVLAGSLAAGGAMTWPLATALAVAASVAGDVAGYGIGRFASDRFLDRHGRLVGYAGRRRARVERMFARWGGVTVLMTRTLVSPLSSLTSLLAGVSRYAFAAFLAYATVGRVVWTAAYFGLGFFIGGDLEAASGFLGNVTGLLIAVLAAAMGAAYLVRERAGLTLR